MIISTENKIAVFLVPRTGTSSLSTLFQQSGANLHLCRHSHANMTSLDQVASEENIDLTGFRYYAFYREPYDRAVSIVNYIRRGRQCSKFYHAFFGDRYPVSCAGRQTYRELSPELQAVNDSVPFIEVFRRFKWFFEKGAYGKTHKRWLDHPEVQPLNFHDYDGELNRLLVEFGLNPSTVNKPVMNQSIYIPELDVLSASEEQEIRDYLSEDYEFLASRGIRFT